MRRLAHLSDLHFGADPEGQPKLFEGLVAAFEGQPVDALVFTGDVFDSNEPNAAHVEGFVGLHASLEAKVGGPRPTLILPGNHDRRAEGVFSPYREELFDALRARFANRPDVQVLGARSPFLAQRVTLPGFDCDVVAYDSAYLPNGVASAGGVVRQEDLIQVGSELGREDRPLLFLLHHHLIPTPVTDTSVIDTKGRPPLQKLAVGKVLPWLVANGDREELTMTALGAGSALTTLQTLGRAVLVLHGHKHYATARLLKGLDEADGDLLVTSAGSSGLTQDWTGGDYAEAPRLWPSVNFLAFDGPTVEVSSLAWSPWQPERRSSTRRLVRATRAGLRWNVDTTPRPPREFRPVLELNESLVELLPSQARLGRLDVVVERRLRSNAEAWLDTYWEVIEGAPGAVARELVVDGASWRDAKCPARVRVGRDGVSRYRIEGGLFSNLGDANGKAYASVELLNRSRAREARLVVKLGPVKSAPFASVTNLTNGQERPWPLSREGDVVTVRHVDCPARTLLRLYWPLER
ncbi:MAG: metallophosphoesterase family protein [Myxococcota bacterium]